MDKRVPRARSLRRDMTEAEKRLWQQLRQPPFKAHHFRRQATIGQYFADFASHQLRMMIEVDGGQHADNSADDLRTSTLISKGYRVLRFWNNDVMANLPGVLLEIERAISADRPPTPDPSPPQAQGCPGNDSLCRSACPANPA
jgi:very-short-patch-repair endonuclease